LVATAVAFVVRREVLPYTSIVQRTTLVTAAYLTVYLAIVIGILRVWAPFRSAWALIGDVLPAPLQRALKPASLVERKNFEHV
jgi:hypothetical protein